MNTVLQISAKRWVIISGGKIVSKPSDNPAPLQKLCDHWNVPMSLWDCLTAEATEERRVLTLTYDL